MKNLLTFTEIYEKTEKTNFTKQNLLPLCSKIDMRIIDMNYLFEEQSKEEYIEVVYDNSYKKRVCVTADSLRAMTRDVLKEI
mgnify:FL=1